MLTPIRAKRLPFIVWTSDRSWGQKARQASQNSLQDQAGHAADLVPLAPRVQDAEQPLAIRGVVQPLAEEGDRGRFQVREVLLGQLGVELFGLGLELDRV